MVKLELKGLHWTSKALAAGSRRFYYYAWKGGPLIHTSDRLLARATPELLQAWQTEQAKRKDVRAPCIDTMIADFKGSPEWKALAPRTQADYRRWLDQISDEFGMLDFDGVDDRGVIKHFVAFRNKWAHSPRQADMAVATLKGLLEWGRGAGLIDHNRAATIGKLYSVDKSEQVWTMDQIEAACSATVKDPVTGRTRPVAPEVQRAIRLGASVGLRLGDLADLRLSEVLLDHIARPTNKSRQKRIARVPLIPEARRVIDECRAAHQTLKPPRKPKDGRDWKPPETVLFNTKGRSWTASGLSHAITEAAQAAGVDRTTHDLRRTCATRLAAAGFSDQEIGDWLGWTGASVQKLRRVYVDQTAVILSAVARLKKNETGR